LDVPNKKQNLVCRFPYKMSPCQSAIGGGAYWAGHRPLFASNGQVMMLAIPLFALQKLFLNVNFTSCCAGLIGSLLRILFDKCSHRQLLH